MDKYVQKKNIVDNISNLYNEKYYQWQSHIGEFGGKANLFKFEKEIEKNDVVLDFGCGGGYLLKNIICKKKIGIEINQSAKNQALLNGIEVYDSLDFIENSSIDIIISNHALEHLPSPLETLKSLYHKLKLGGKIVFVVPHQGPDENYNANDLNNHLYTWNQQTLGNLFKHAGYNIIYVKNIQHQWPQNYTEIFYTLGNSKFHNECKKFAKQNNNYQVKIVAQRPKLINKKNTKYKTPVVLITYNRPYHTLQVLKSLELNNIKNLIIYSDAPKTEHDIKNVLVTRKIIENVKWTTPKVVYQKNNQGLAKSIVTAVNSVFKNHDRMILLEDDCVPSKYFFDFIHDCLNKYENDERIFGISGYTVPIPQQTLERHPYDLYFHPRIGSWGWATWKKAWEKYDPDLRNLYKKCIEQGIDITIGGRDIPINLEKIIAGELLDVWTLNWLLAVYLNKGFYIYPTLSHINNIGFDGTGVHCGKTNKYNTNFSKYKPIKFPDSVILDTNLINNLNSFYGNENISQQRLNFYYNTKLSINDPQSAVKIKVAQFCMQDFGGAGTAALRLHEGLLGQGVNNFFFVQNMAKWQQGSSLLTKSTPPKTNQKFISPEWRAFQTRTKANLSKYPKRPSGLEMFSIPWAATKLKNLSEVANTDIINLHWISGTLSIPENIDFLKGRKIVWTLHDMNPFTGGCHYTAGCQKYEQQCGSCPQLGSNQDNDLSREIWKLKMTAYRQLDITIVVLCQWMADCVKNSSLLSSFPIQIIPNGVPTNVFKPYPQAQIRDSLHVSKDAFVVLFGADSVNNARKGFRYLLQALDVLKNEYKQDNIILAVFGRSNDITTQHLGYQTICFDYVEKDSELAMIYSMADVTVIPSLEDNLPNIVLESLACGTPVVGFNVGGIPDMVAHQINGYLAAVGDAYSLAEGILWIKNQDQNRKKIRLKCRETVLTKYNLLLQAKRYEALYKETMRNHTDYSL